jgi:hypothetical protein
MSSEPCITPAPVGQQGPPTRVAAFDSWRSLRDAREPLLLGYGDGALPQNGEARAQKI